MMPVINPSISVATVSTRPKNRFQVVFHQAGNNILDIVSHLTEGFLNPIAVVSYHTNQQVKESGEEFNDTADDLDDIFGHVDECSNEWIKRLGNAVDDTQQ